MEVNEIVLDKLVQLVFNGIRDKRWLYWPPGPMTSQVFDRDSCKFDIRRFLESEVYPIVREVR